MLILVLHHVIVDYWSTALLLNDLCSLLEQDLPPAAAMRFLDYVEWRRESDDSQRLARELEYWRAKLGGELPVLDLPSDRARPAVMSRRGRAVPAPAIPQDLMERLKRFADAEGTTLFVTLLAAYNVLLLRLTGQSDLIVGAPLAGRDHPIAETIVGCFVRTVGLRTVLDGDSSFLECGASYALYGDGGAGAPDDSV